MMALQTFRTLKIVVSVKNDITGEAHPVPGFFTHSVTEILQVFSFSCGQALQPPETLFPQLMLKPSIFYMYHNFFITGAI